MLRTSESSLLQIWIKKKISREGCNKICKIPSAIKRKTKMTNYSLLCVTNIIILFNFLLTVAYAKQFIVEHPQNTTARLGDTVVLKCRVENQKGTLQWVKNGFGLGTTRDLPLIERYTMVGKLNLGEYHLKIKNVSVEDDDLYECQLSPTDNEPIQISKAAQLSVIAKPDALTLINLEATPIQKQQLIKNSVITIEAIEGSNIDLSCRSANGRPAARLKWAITADAEARNIISYITGDLNSSVLVHPHHEKSREHLPDAVDQRFVGKIIETIETNAEGFSTTTTNLIFFPTKAVNEKYLACLAFHETFFNKKNNIIPKSVSVALDVSYQPKIRIEVDERESSLMEGGRLVFKCNVDAKPSHDLNVKWSWNGDEKRLAILDQHTAMLSGLKIKDNGAIVFCTATNSIGTDSASIKLDIPYGPRFKSTNQTILVRQGDSATFQCKVVGNPIPEVKWYRKGNNDFIATGINDVNEWEAGEYKCVAIVLGFEPKSLTHQLYLKGPPEVNMNKKLIYEISGGVTLSCEIQSRVLPLKIVWIYNNRILSDTEVTDSGPAALKKGSANAKQSLASPRFRVYNAIRSYGVESRLTLLKFSFEDYGFYNCTAHNEFGASHSQLHVFQRTIWQKIEELTETLSQTYRIAILVATICVVICILFLCCIRCHKGKGSNGKSSLRACCYCLNEKSASSNFSHDNSGDVIVKCEAIDGVQFYPELYGSPQIDRSDIVYTKDYMSVPQSNPDFDYMPPLSMNFGVSPYGAPQQNSLKNPYSLHQTFSTGNSEHGTGMICGQNKADFSNVYDNYGGSSRFNGNMADMYSNYDGKLYGPREIGADYIVGNASTLNRGGMGLTPNGMMMMGSSPLETLAEVATPESDGGGGIGDGSGSGDALLTTGMHQQRPISRISTHV